jgi:hypothetical protein
MENLRVLRIRILFILSKNPRLSARRAEALAKAGVHPWLKSESAAGIL